MKKKIFSFLLFFLLVSATAYAKDSNSNPKKTKIAVLNFEAKGVNVNLADNLNELFLSKIHELNLYEVISGRDIKLILGYEWEKQKLGCTDSEVCLAEIGGALGANKIVSGIIGKIGNKYLFSTKVIDVKTISVNNRHSESVEDDPAQLVDLIPKIISKLFQVDLNSDNNELDLKLDSKSPNLKQSGVSKVKKPWYKTWWFWVISGSAVVTASVFALTSKGDDIQKNKGVDILFKIPEKKD